MWSWFQKQKNSEKQALVFGNEGSGRYSLFQALMGEAFVEGLASPELYDFNMAVGNEENETHIHFYIDTTTPEKKQLPRFPETVICIIDLSSKTALEDYSTLKQRVSIHYPKSKSIFVGTKHDISSLDQSLSTDDLIITSAKTMEGIEQLKQTIADGHHGKPQANATGP